MPQSQNSYDYLGISFKTQAPPDYELYQTLNPTQQRDKFTNSKHQDPIRYIVRRPRNPIPETLDELDTYDTIHGLSKDAFSF